MESVQLKNRVTLVVLFGEEEHLEKIGGTSGKQFLETSVLLGTGYIGYSYITEQVPQRCVLKIWHL